MTTAMDGLIAVSASSLGLLGSGASADVVVLVVSIVIVAFLFAKVEIQIEGVHGWAAKLPTWRIEKHLLLTVFFGGRPLTGYHLWAILFMGAVFHLPLAILHTFSIKAEARVLGSLILFWMIEDFLWFVLNPAYGIRRFKNEHIGWHNRWVGPVPLDYVVACVAGAAFLTYSFMGK